MAILLNSLQWLRNSSEFPKFLWKPKGSSLVTLASGAQWQSENHPTFPKDGPFCFSAMRFSENKRGAPWDHFPKRLFCSPKTWRIESIDSVAPPSPFLDFSNRKDYPNLTDWKKNVSEACALIESKKLEKVVLARQTKIETPSAIDPWLCVAHLFQAASSSSIFAIQIDPHRAFIGATPETLFSRQGRTVNFEALASTVPIGKDRKEELFLEKNLLSGEKELREFRFVESFIQECLTKLNASNASASSRQIIKTPHVQHLYRMYKAQIPLNIDDQKILTALHPTPALGGTPREEALRFIERIEPFDRGWYGAPLGMLSQEESFLSVAIRSAVIENNLLHLYAGAGIVEGSDPEKEWQELESKIRLFIQMGK